MAVLQGGFVRLFLGCFAGQFCMVVNRQFFRAGLQGCFMRMFNLQFFVAVLWCDYKGLFCEAVL
jgi:hypothetical protein